MALDATGCGELLVCEPGEYRLASAMATWSGELAVPVQILEDRRFLASHDQFQQWAAGRKQLRMEYFYRDMRRQYGVLLDGAEPCGGKWNYDSENRVGWRGQCEIPERPDLVPDAITSEVIALVERGFPSNPGDLTQFRLAVTRDDAQAQFDWFCNYALANFGTYQDALVEESPLGVSQPHIHVLELRFVGAAGGVPAGGAGVARRALLARSGRGFHPPNSGLARVRPRYLLVAHA